MANQKSLSDLIELYKQMTDEQRDEEIEAIMDFAFAMLEAQESDSISTYPNPNIELKISCTVIQDEGKWIN
jgi:hypothetical protein